MAVVICYMICHLVRTTCGCSKNLNEWIFSQAEQLGVSPTQHYVIVMYPTLTQGSIHVWTVYGVHRVIDGVMG